MGILKRYFKQQLSWNKFTLRHEDASQFYLSSLQKNSAPFPLLLLRLILFLGCVAMVTTSLIIRVERTIGYWFIYMTNWGIILIMVTSGFAFVVSARSYFKGPIDSTFGLPWYVKLFWAVYNTSITVGFFITIFYYSLLYRFAGVFEWNPVLDLFVHGMNSVVMFILLMTSQHPSHLLHFIYPVSFAIIYMVFSVIYYYAGGLNEGGEPWIYPVLDWSNPGSTTGLVFASAGFLIVLHCFVVLLSLLRDYLSKRFVRNFNSLTINT